MKKSFTLIELMVVLSVFVLLSGAMMVNFKSGGMGSSLKRDASKMALNLRKVEEMSIAAKEFSGSLSTDKCSNCYGIEFVGGRNYYTLFSDLDNDYKYDGGREFIESVYLEGKNIIESNPYYKIISSGIIHKVNNLTIVFYPPDPTVIVDKRNDSEGFIVIKNPSNNDTKMVGVNRVGLINVYGL
jgi:type II secretory pathway pseudopilin PulG